MARPVADPKGGSSLWDLKVHSMSRDYFAIANPFTLGPPSSQGVRIEKLRVLPPQTLKSWVIKVSFILSGVKSERPGIEPPSPIQP